MSAAELMLGITKQQLAEMEEEAREIEEILAQMKALEEEEDV